MGVEVSHLFFADDTLILYDASKKNLEHLSWVFMWFESYSWLKINLGKSKLIPIGDVPNLEELVGSRLQGGCPPNHRPRSSFGYCIQVF